MGQQESVLVQRTAITSATPGSLRHCTRCECLCFSGPTPGVCPAGGQHDLYPHLEFIGSSGPGWAWRVCSRCSSFCLSGGVDGPCSAGGKHQKAHSPDVILGPSSSSFTSKPEPSSWRLCRRCDVLFLFREQSSPTGACSAGGFHEPSGETFTLTSRQPVAPLQPSLPGSPGLAGAGGGIMSQCKNCQGKGAFGTFGPCERNSIHFKTACPTCSGAGYTTLQSACPNCQGKGGMGAFGPCSLVDMHFKHNCGMCGGRAFLLTQQTVLVDQSCTTASRFSLGHHHQTFSGHNHHHHHHHHHNHIGLGLHNQHHGHHHFG